VTDEIRLDPSWPGLDVPAGQLEVDLDALLDLARRLEREANYLSGDGAGTPTRLAEETSLPCVPFGTWQTAYEMEAGHAEARRHVVHVFGELVQAMRDTAAMARQTAGAHGRVDDDLRADLDGRQAALGEGQRQAEIA
jgi:hypothetical protein